MIRSGTRVRYSPRRHLDERKHLRWMPGVKEARVQFHLRELIARLTPNSRNPSLFTFSRSNHQYHRLSFISADDDDTHTRNSRPQCIFHSTTRLTPSLFFVDDRTASFSFHAKFNFLVFTRNERGERMVRR